MSIFVLVFDMHYKYELQVIDWCFFLVCLRVHAQNVRAEEKNGWNCWMSKNCLFPLQTDWTIIIVVKDFSLRCTRAHLHTRLQCISIIIFVHSSILFIFSIWKIIPFLFFFCSSLINRTGCFLPLLETGDAFVYV